MPGDQNIKILESRNVISKLLYIREVGRCRKMDIYENVSRNANMVQHIRELERIGVLDVNEENIPSTIRLTEKGVTIADLLMVISRTI